MGEDETRAVIERFNAAFNRHDLDGVAAGITDDCVFVDTSHDPHVTQGVPHPNHAGLERRNA
jgi:ketosteroid isomerase-like protein